MASILGAVSLSGCGNQTARSPNATQFRWPEQVAYRIDYVSTAERDHHELVKFAETKTARFMDRDGRYLVSFDSVLKTSQRPGEPLQLISYQPEDTLQFYMKVGARGEISDVALGCDPVLPACRAVLPSSALLEMRRLIPRLPVWQVPVGGSWLDTVRFDDADRPGGTRGSVVISYAGRHDTTISGRVYWMISWRSIRRSFVPGAEARADLGAQGAIEEAGITLVDKQLLLPAYSTWAGAVAAPPNLRAMGATGSGFRGRAYLTGSVFDSLYSRELVP